VGQHCEQAVRVARVGYENDPAPELIDPDRAKPWVPAVVHLLQVQAGERVLPEFRHRRFDQQLHRLLQLRVVAEKALGDRQPRQLPHLPAHDSLTLMLQEIVNR